MEKKAIVIGASSGIGKALAEVLSKNGYSVGLAARRKELLLDLQSSLPNPSFVKQIDISQTEQAMKLLEELIDEMGGVDLIIINSGIGFINPDLEWDKERQTIEVNVLGFCAMAAVSMHHFFKRENGHLAAISSISALRGVDQAPAYGASKAFMSRYMEALQMTVFKKRLPITITDIKPGFVRTGMAKSKRRFWEASPEEAAEQIYDAIKNKKPHAYITRRWRLIAWLIKILPNWIYYKVS